MRIERLDTHLESEESSLFKNELRHRIIGQEEAVKAVADTYQAFRVGLNSTGRPVGNLLFLGPTGTGKTFLVESAAEILFGDPRAVIKVDCAEFQHSHEIAKLIGSPPGYLGHRETHPLITQEALNQYHREDMKLSFLLFDEIEKASDALWNLLLGILDKATLTLGDNRRVDLSETMIFLTSNLGSKEIEEILKGPGLGFSPNISSNRGKIETSALNSARKRFSAEFVNRLDRMVVFHQLNPSQLEDILTLEIENVQSRILKTALGQFLIQVNAPAREFLLQEGTDARYGARHLKRAIEKHLIHPLAALLDTGQIDLGDVIGVDLEGTELIFTLEAEHAIVAAALPQGEEPAMFYGAASGAITVDDPSDGKLQDAPLAAANKAIRKRLKK